MKRRIASVILVLALCVSLSTPALTTSEQPSSWAVEQVNAAVAANLVPHSLQSNYTQAITRAEFCALAVTLYEKIRGEIEGRKIFEDTNDINVEKMAAVGVVSGVGNNRFAPDNTVTREQAAVMLSRLAEAIGMRFSTVYHSFDDNSDISEWATLEVAQMWFTGIMSGVGNNTFLPKGNYTREQSIVTILRSFNAFQLGAVSIKYNASGGDGAPSGHEVYIAPSIGGDEFGVTWQQIMFAIPDEVPTRNGYVFMGWTSDYFFGQHSFQTVDLFEAVGIHVVDGLTITLSAIWVEAVEIDLRFQDITNEQLAKMVENGEISANVTRLDLAGNRSINDISPLSNLTNLRELDLWGNRIIDLSPLSNLINLTELNLWGAQQFEDISPLRDLVNLRVFALGDNLKFNGDLSILRNFTKLTDLALGDTWQHRMDFSYIEGLVNLKSLSLWGAGQLRDLSIIGSLTSLTTLTMHSANIEDFAPLRNLTNLTRLELQSSDIRDISSLPLNSLPNLTELQLWNVQITDITPLSGLTSLTRLDLGQNRINDISPLSEMTALRFLTLSNNQIKDVSPLSGLTAMIILFLNENQIKDISPLRNLRNLRQLVLGGNPLTDAQINELQTALPNSPISTWDHTIVIPAEGTE